MLTVAVSLATCDVARATTVTVKFLGVQPAGRRAVHINDHGSTSYVYAGLYTFETLGINPDNASNPAFYLEETFGGFCIDPEQRIHTNEIRTFEVVELADAPIAPGTPMGDLRATYLSRLYGSSFAATAEFQMAAWELIREDSPDGFDIGTGNFRGTRLGEFDYLSVNAMIDLVTDPDYAGPTTSILLGLGNSEAQDYMVPIEQPKGPVVPEPLTATALLMGVGRLAAYVRGRFGRRSRA